MEIRKLSFDEEPPMPLLLTADPSEEIVREYLTKGECFVAESDDQVVGVYTIVSTRPKTIELVNIAVKEDFQGKGIGKNLLQDVIHRAKTSGFETIEVGTGNSSIGQLVFYQKCGFRITGVDRDFFIRNYSEPIYENGIRCQDMVRLAVELTDY